MLACWGMVVRMLTTVGLASCASVRKVEASSAPVSGALLVAGTVREPANEAGDNPSLDARTMPTTTDARAIMTV